MKRKLFYGIVIIALLSTVGMVLATPAQSPNLFGPNWKVYNRIYLPNGNTVYMVTHPDTIPTGGIQFAIPDQSQAFSNYLVTNYNPDLTGKTIKCTIHVVASPGTTFVNRGGSPNTEAVVRIEFQDTSSGTYGPNDYWRYTSEVSLTSLTSGTFTITASTSDRASWTNLAFKPATDTTAPWTNIDGTVQTVSPYDGFTNALANVKEVGFSFGGGGYYANGVAVSSGSATFQLLALTVS